MKKATEIELFTYLKNIQSTTDTIHADKDAFYDDLLDKYNKIISGIGSLREELKTFREEARDNRKDVVNVAKSIDRGLDDIEEAVVEVLKPAIKENWTVDRILTMIFKRKRKIDTVKLSK